MLTYENGEEMMDWLVAAFGFVETERWVEGGRLSHGELTHGDAVIMVAAPCAEYQSFRTVQENYAPAREWAKYPYVFNGVLVKVNDVRGHCEHARSRGAVILSEVEDGFPGLRYRAEDPEGHRWFFLQA